METRIFWLKMLLAFASLIGTSHLADAQEKSPQKTKAPAPKSADHATTGDQNALGEMNNPDPQGGGDLAWDDPRRGHRASQRLVT